MFGGRERKIMIKKKKIKNKKCHMKWYGKKMCQPIILKNK